MVDGRRVRQAIQVPKIHWTPAAGQVARSFDDVLVLAGETLPAHLVEALEPWDLDGMRPFTPDYLTGFEGELYQLPVDGAFERAQALMREVIAGDIRADIGGDQQMIERMEVAHDATTFKHVLLPVWVAAFIFVGRSFRFVVNGRTGEVHGERPWSFWKIAGAVALGRHPVPAAGAAVLAGRGPAGYPARRPLLMARCRPVPNQPPEAMAASSVQP